VSLSLSLDDISRLVVVAWLVLHLSSTSENVNRGRRPVPLFHADCGLVSISLGALSSEPQLPEDFSTSVPFCLASSSRLLASGAILLPGS